MKTEQPKLRDSRKSNSREPYPINEIPDDLVVDIAGHLVYLLCTGRKDITGSDWGDAFADATGGTHLDSPVGIADLVVGKMAWSVKTIKSNHPFAAQTVRLISGRCSPDYSYGITDPHKDIQKTGRAVLGIWNERINIAQDHYSPLRTAVLLRSADLRSFCLFEEEIHRYRTNDYVWETNPNGNLIGKHATTGKTHFTWQPHGSQFTIHTDVPPACVRFSIQQPPVFGKEKTLANIGFDASWVKIEK